MGKIREIERMQREKKQGRFLKIKIKAKFSYSLFFSIVIFPPPEHRYKFLILLKYIDIFIAYFIIYNCNQIPIEILATTIL